MKKMQKTVCRLAGFVCACAVAAAGMLPLTAARVFFEEESGESPEALLAETGEVWETSAAATAVNAKGAVLMEAQTGQVLFDQNAKAHLPIASVTKVMTLLLVMEAIDSGKISWDQPVTCSAEAAALGGSQIWLEPGEIMSVEELVKAACVVSANDACGALAETVSGSMMAFVDNMNERAAQLGMADTRFADCSGLDDSGYSCAYDVAVMSRELLKHPAITRFTTIWTDSLRGGNSMLVNTNKLVRHYAGITGLKTGTTQAAGHCLTATATREGTSFVAVMLGSPTTADRFNGARALLDWGFANFAVVSLPMPVLPELPVLRGQEEQVKLTVEAPATVLTKKGQSDQWEGTLSVAEDVEAPVEAGQTVGVWKVTAGEETVGEYPVKTAAAVPAITFRWAYTLLFELLVR